MFERELVDVTFLQRWGIVRTIRPQSVAEHTFLVAHYVNDICHLLSIHPMTHLVALRYALWHDVDEVFTGDVPGPSKRGLLDAIGPDAKGKWDARASEWSDTVFRDRKGRMGGQLPPKDAQVVRLIVKTADWLEASVKMATESQMGNGCTTRHINPNLNGALQSAKALIECLYSVTLSDDVPFDPLNQAETAYRTLCDALTKCVDFAWRGQSRGPWITKEDEKRNHDEPCVK